MLLNYRSVESEEIVRITAWHGTNAAHIASIQSEGFKPSIGYEHDEWLGEGSYFFMDGQISDLTCTQLAKAWAVAESFDAVGKPRKYLKGVVLKVLIEAEGSAIVDFRTTLELRNFNIFRSKYLERLRKMGVWGDEIFDGPVLRGFCESGGYELIINNFFIKFTNERRMRYHGKIANCTILCVLPNFEDRVQLDTLEIVDTFAVL